MTLALMCGLSFSGKSTFARQLANELAAELISLDVINAERGLDGGQGIPLDEWVGTNHIAHTRAAVALRSGRDVVIDDTGSPRFIRDQWREVVTEVGASFVIVWVQIDTARQRARVFANRSNICRGDVTDEVLEAHAASFDEPVDEGPIAIDADDTNDAERVHEVAALVRQLDTR